MLTFTEKDVAPVLLQEGRMVITTVTNSGYLLYTLNMLKSLRPYGLDKHVFILCMDSACATRLRRQGYTVYDVEQPELSRFCPWNTKGYDHICYVKLLLIHRLLSFGVRVLLTDGDIVFQKNPMEDWKRWWATPEYDVWIQNDSQKPHDTTNMCTGYMMLSPQPALLEAYDVLSDKGKERYRSCAFDNNDQTFFNNYVKPICRMYPLSLEEYPNGKMYMEHTARVQPRAVLVHFNWIRGHMKMAKMKEYRMWLLTPEEEES